MRIFGLLLLALAPLAAQRHHDDRDWKLNERETIRHTFDLGSGSNAKKLLVDNISGSIHITGYGGSQVQVVAEKHIFADSQEAMQEAKRDVKLDFAPQGNYARVYVDGPFRSGNGTNYRGDSYYNYRVDFDFEIQVPYDTELEVKTLNHGEIQVKKTTGDYSVSALNVPIDLDEISGAGSIHTLNGKVRVAYSKNPSKPVNFHTLNGSIDVYFQPGLNADLSFQRLNGAVYTDFEVTGRPTNVSSDGVGKFVYRGGRSISGRTGAGGPELSFHTLNGTIRLHSKN